MTDEHNTPRDSFRPLFNPGDPKLKVITAREINAGRINAGPRPLFDRDARELDTKAFLTGHTDREPQTITPEDEHRASASMRAAIWPTRCDDLYCRQLGTQHEGPHDYPSRTQTVSEQPRQQPTQNPFLPEKSIAQKNHELRLAKASSNKLGLGLTGLGLCIASASAFVAMILTDQPDSKLYIAAIPLALLLYVFD